VRHDQIERVRLAAALAVASGSAGCVGCIECDGKRKPPITIFAGPNLAAAGRVSKQADALAFFPSE